jgi:hypothetical protein
MRLSDEHIRSCLEMHRLKAAGLFSKHMSDDEKKKKVEEHRQNNSTHKTGGGGVAIEWPCRTKEERVAVLQIMVGQLHWSKDREPRLSQDPMLALGETHAPGNRCCLRGSGYMGGGLMLVFFFLFFLFFLFFFFFENTTISTILNL